MMELTIENADTWLDQKFFQTVIKNHLNLEHYEYKITETDLKPATKTGDNYLSVMIRAKVQIKVCDETKKLSYVIKALLKTAIFTEWATEFGAYPKEKKLYFEVIPAFEALWKAQGHEVSFGPK
jgi:hypothetical protein